MKIVFSIFAIFFWLFFSAVFVLTIIFFFPYKTNNEFSFLVASSSENIFHDPADSYNQIGDVLSAVKGGDARVVLVDRFLEKYNSPMRGLGNVFVDAADKNNIDWRLLPALAFQESNLGKKIPRNSFNPFGWTIYEGQNSGTYFESWEQGIYIVAKRMHENYISQGFSSPETIVTRYTSGKDNPTWVFAVKSAMQELGPDNYQ